MLFGRTTRKPISIPAKAVKEWKYSTCNYCSTGCVIELGLNDAGKIVTSRGHAGADVNRGKLCIKGILEQELFESPGRGSQPLMRERAHLPFQAASWDAALDKTAAKIKEIQAKYGRDAFAVVSTGQLLTEEFYTLGKLVRGQIGTNNYDGNTTLCMASAVSGYKRSFGSDGPPGCYGDFEHTHCLKAFGSNLAGFTAFAQSALYVPLAIVCLGLVGFGLFMSTLHLGKPLRFYRGFNNLRHSPVSREGLGIAIFMSALGGHIVFSLPGNSLF